MVQLVNKDEFNALEILEQVKYINKGLELESVTKVCAKIGIDRATVRKRFERNGYKLESGKYIATENTPNTTTTKPTENTPNKPIKKATNKTQDNKNIKVLESKIESLEKQIENINNTLNTITTKTTNNTTTKDTIKVKKYKGVEGVRSYRVNAKVLEQWKVFCKAHSEHKVGDLVANALVDYMNKFK